MTIRLILTGLICLATCRAQAQDTLQEARGAAHFQFTAISQGHFAFKSDYAGKNSLQSKAQWGATSITSTLFLGKRLWKGAAFYLNPEISGGEGLSGALGVGGGLNGETYRVARPSPSIYVARAYLQQHIALPAAEWTMTDDDINQVKMLVPTRRLTLSAGRLELSDFFDDNKYAHDAREQFSNWALMANGAWDYPANTRGYNYIAQAEWAIPGWAARISTAAVPTAANGANLEYGFNGKHSEALQLDRFYKLKNKPGAVRLLYSQNFSRQPAYRSGLQALITGDSATLRIFEGEREGTAPRGKKLAVGISAEQELSQDMGAFMRIGWNDGKYATWAFTEIDRSLSFGLNINGNRIKRPDDVLGIGIAINGLSQPHRDFLRAGGYGFILGDGTLNNAPEQIAEIYYCARFTHFCFLTLDYQLVVNPGYNAARGPVSAVAMRAHVRI